MTANLASALYLHNAGVPVRRSVTLEDGRLGSHAKFALIDDTALVGSRNWTDDGFRLQGRIDQLGASFGFIHPVSPFKQQAFLQRLLAASPRLLNWILTGQERMAPI
ncbi:MAG: hypothetical protein WD397_05495 [Wenzhouxiangellaceae bacterium]